MLSENMIQRDLYTDEINLHHLILIVWRRKLVVFMFTLLGAFIAIGASLSIEDVYRAESIMMPVAEGGQSGLGGLASQYGGLASLAGINLLRDSGGRVSEGLAILQSRKFIIDFITRRDLLVPLMAAKSWDTITGELVIDREIYRPDKEEWNERFTGGNQIEPSMQSAYGLFLTNHLETEVDQETGFVKIIVKHLSPIVAKRWVDWLVEDINHTIKQADVENAEASIAYLEEQLQKTSLAELQNVFYQLIESQMKTVMLANGRKEYIFRTLDPAVVPESPYLPNRKLIIVLGLFAGFAVGSALTILHAAIHDGGYGPRNVSGQ